MSEVDVGEPNVLRAVTEGPGTDRRRFIIGALVLALAGLVVGQRAEVLLTDTLRDVYLVPSRVIANSLSAWSRNSYLGAPNYDTGLLPVALVAWVLRHGGSPAWLAARLVKLALLLIAAVGAARCYRWLRLPIGRGGAGPLVAAVVYVVNPFALTGASSLPVLQPYALLPWLVVALDGALRRGTWRSGCVAALLFAAMGGQNAGVVPLLILGLLLPVMLVHARLAEGRSVRASARGALRFGLFAGLLSAYWLIPAATAFGAGSAVAGSTETPSSVAATSSYAEVLRGLGLWTIYGRGARGPFEPRFVDFITAAPVVIASFCWPVLGACGAVVSRAKGRLLAVLLVLVGAVACVGLYPVDHPSAWGRGLAWAFAHVPGLIAFRTTVKAGPLLALGLTLLTATAVVGLASQVGASRRHNLVVGVVTCAILFGWIWPALTGALYSANLPVPTYWSQLAADLNASASGGRVLFLPGQASADYRWGAPSPDDIASSLLTQDAVIRTAVPATTPEAANFLAALDLPLEAGRLRPGVLSMFARYLGVTDVVVRNDVVWEDAHGARPATVVSQVGADPGLKPVAPYGAPGLNVVSPSGGTGPQAALEAKLSPLLRYQVLDSGPATRAENAEGAVLLDGDASAFPALLGSGLLSGGPSVLLAGGMTGPELSAALGDAGALVLTDTNRRRVYDGHVVAATGPLLGPQEPLGASRALYGPDEQTVLGFGGPVASVSASASGSIFGPVSGTGPERALDGDPATAWRFGDFGTALGQQWHETFTSSRSVPSITVTPLRTGPVRPTRIRVLTDNGQVTVALATAGSTTVALPPGVTRNLMLEVTATAGSGINGIGFSEITVPGVVPRPLARLPIDLPDRLRSLGTVDPAKVKALSLEVDLHQDSQDAETVLARRFRLPDDRGFLPQATLRPSASMTDAQADVLVGQDPSVRVTASSRFDGRAQFRGSEAFDGNPLTQWVPDGNPVGQSLTARYPAREVSSVRIEQGVGTGDGAQITKAMLRVGEDPAQPITLHPGITVVPIASRLAGSLSLAITSVSGQGQPGLVAVDPGSAVAPRPAGPSPCLKIATLDGAPLTLQPDVGRASLLDSATVPMSACREAQVPLHGGDHILLGSGNWVVDELRLMSSSATTPSPAQAPAVRTERPSASKYVMDVAPATAPYFLMTGTAYDPRWRAQADGISLGPPQLLDGFTVGWRVTDLRAHHVVVTFGPQRAVLGGVLTSLAALFGGLAVVLAGLRRRSRERAAQVRWPTP